MLALTTHQTHAMPAGSKRYTGGVENGPIAEPWESGISDRARVIGQVVDETLNLVLHIFEFFYRLVNRIAYSCIHEFGPFQTLKIQYKRF